MFWMRPGWSQRTHAPKPERSTVVRGRVTSRPATSVCCTDGAVCDTLQVGCKMHFSVKRYMHPQLRHLYKIIMSEAAHSGHSKDAPIPGHARRSRLSNDAHAHIAGLAVLGVPTNVVISRWHEYLRGQHAACKDFPAQVSRVLLATHALRHPASADNLCKPDHAMQRGFTQRLKVACALA